ncbi:hypothetical protein PV783_34000 [Chitinophaga sp. CC14]|uniref:hypothetical protein n=1 Tax=Chitinophaga sp. CC14 TaxID=3029199 RepID=UPI003B7FC3B8
MSLKTELEAAQQRMDTFVKDIEAKIRALPDNPNIQRKSESPNTFTMSFSELAKGKAGNLSAEHYDYKYQYEQVIKYLFDNTADAYVIAKHLEQVINTGKIVRPDQGTLVLHTEVVKYLNELYTGEPGNQLS